MGKEYDVEKKKQGYVRGGTDSGKTKRRGRKRKTNGGKKGGLLATWK